MAHVLPPGLERHPTDDGGRQPAVLTITELRGAEYLIASVAGGLADDDKGIGEAPGVWRGHWAAELGLERVVAVEALRPWSRVATPEAATTLLAGLRERTVRAIDVTLSVPKPVSVLWAFGTPRALRGRGGRRPGRPATGLRATESRFSQAHVVERVVALSAGSSSWPRCSPSASASWPPTTWCPWCPTPIAAGRLSGPPSSAGPWRTPSSPTSTLWPPGPPSR